jgi:AcrR family transcriptional regulator
VTTSATTRTTILAAGKDALLTSGYAGLSTRRVADAAGVPLSQIHYHFGSKQNLVLALLDEENARLLDRQHRLYGAELPLWQQWQQACDYLDDDLASGYVRVLQEMTAAGWSNDEVAAAVRRDLSGWFDLLADTASKVAERIGGLGPFTPAEVATLVGGVFLGLETTILLGFDQAAMPARPALRKIGSVLRALEERYAGAAP